MPHPWLQGISQALRTVPSQCAICHAWPAQRLCDDCVRRFARQRPRCRTCALAVPEGVAHCGACLRHPNGLDACHAAVDYGYPWSGVLQAFKFRGDPGWAGALATLLRSTPWVEPALEAAELVLPIPLAPQRLRMRGFNQALLLAQALAPARVQAGLLLRTHDTPAQSGLDRARRLRNLARAFAVEPLCAAQLAGRQVLLVDDVMTTGATLQAAAAVLRQAGAARVTALVLARTPQD
jgi:ComF family protein